MNKAYSFLKKWWPYFRSIFVFIILIIFLVFYEDRNYISWKEVFKEANIIWRTPFFQRLTSRYPQVLKTPFYETDDHISISKVERVRRQLLRKGERTVWIKYPQNSSLYTNPLKLNIYQRIVEILYPVKIDPQANYELILETDEKGEFILKLIKNKK